MPSANGLAFPCRKICPRFYKRGYGSCLQLKAGNCRLGHKTEWAAYFVSHLTRWCWLILKQEAMKSGNLLHGFMASCFIYFQTEPPPTKRKDGTEVFTIQKQRWVKTWTNRPHPVLPSLPAARCRSRGAHRGWRSSRCARVAWHDRRAACARQFLPPIGRFSSAPDASRFCHATGTAGKFHIVPPTSSAASCQRACCALCCAA